MDAAAVSDGELPLSSNPWKEFDILASIVTRCQYLNSTKVRKLTDQQSPEHRISCHRCGNIRKKRILCSRVACPHTFCFRCCEKMKEEYGNSIFNGGCPVCKELCCCSNKTVFCHRKVHCYRKCPASESKSKSESDTQIGECSTQYGIGNLLSAMQELEQTQMSATVPPKPKLATHDAASGSSWQKKGNTATAIPKIPGNLKDIAESGVDGYTFNQGNTMGTVKQQADFKGTGVPAASLSLSQGVGSDTKQQQQQMFLSVSNPALPYLTSMYPSLPAAGNMSTMKPLPSILNLNINSSVQYPVLPQQLSSKHSKDLTATQLEGAGDRKRKLSTDAGSTTTSRSRSDATSMDLMGSSAETPMDVLAMVSSFSNAIAPKRAKSTTPNE